jgi:hypothetical protein
VDQERYKEFESGCLEIAARLDEIRKRTRAIKTTLERVAEDLDKAKNDKSPNSLDLKQFLRHPDHSDISYDLDRRDHSEPPAVDRRSPKRS